MSDDVRRLTTEEQRERLHLARQRGGLCAACGRVLSDGEPVYVERFVIGPPDGYTTTAAAPVGIECASTEFVERTQGQEPERCAWCGRGVYYRTAESRRRWVTCSKRCAARAGVARRKAEG